MVELVGSIAAFLTTICFIPQAIKTIRQKKTKDLSLVMYILFTTGVGFWLCYGILLQSLPMIVANAITLPLALTILICKLRYK